MKIYFLRFTALQWISPIVCKHEDLALGCQEHINSFTRYHFSGWFRWEYITHDTNWHVDRTWRHNANCKMRRVFRSSEYDYNYTDRLIFRYLWIKNLYKNLCVKRIDFLNMESNMYLQQLMYIVILRQHWYS